MTLQNARIAEELRFDLGLAGDRCAERRLRALRRELEALARAGWDAAARVLGLMWDQGIAVDCRDEHPAKAWFGRSSPCQ